MLRYLFTFILMMAVATSFGQSKKKKKAKEAESTSASQPSSLSPYYPEKKYEPTKKKASKKTTYDATNKFYDRQEAIAKQERKNEKEMDKPQNSDPLYFGHKRPPKKRPPSKMKYCKTCGIRH